MASVDLAESGYPSPAVRTGPYPCRLDVRIIGTLQIRRGDVTLGFRELGGPKPRQILEILLLSLGAPVSKDRLIEVLWAGQAPAEALPTLESYVSVLRRHLQPGRGKEGPLRTVTGGYVVDRSMVDLDLDRFDSLLRRAEAAGPHQAMDLLQEALGLASAPLLGDELLPSWAEEERARHAARVFHARTLAAEAALALDKAETAVTWAREALAYDALSERAWSALILGLEKCGQLTEALRAFEQCRRTMNTEMGCTPGSALRSAHARLLEATADTSRLAPMVGPRLAAPPGTSDLPRVHVPRIRILTINPHRTFTELLTSALNREPDLRTVGAAASAATGVAMSRELAPDVVIMDYNLPDGDGLAAASRILSEAPHVRIVMIAGDPAPEALRRAAAMGVCAFLPKNGSLAAMLNALRYAQPGNAIASPPKPGITVESGHAVDPQPVLTAHELQVLKLLAEGHELRVAALRLNMSLSTCRTYLKAIFAKLGTHTQLETVDEVPQRGMLPLRADG